MAAIWRGGLLGSVAFVPILRGPALAPQGWPFNGTPAPAPTPTPTPPPPPVTFDSLVYHFDDTGLTFDRV